VKIDIQDQYMRISPRFGDGILQYITSVTG